MSSLGIDNPIIQDLPDEAEKRVTFRALALGLLLSTFLAAFNCWIETRFSVHFLGGVPMPFGAIFGLLALILLVNGPLKFFKKQGFSSVELLCIYVMLMLAALVSTPGTDNFFLTIGASLFYFSTRENGWADLFYRFVPSHFAPGWNGKTYQHEVIENLYNGGLNLSQIPWHAWGPLILAWMTFLLLCYAMLFFLALLLRAQWIENEALSFPLVQLPLQMVESSRGSQPPARQFWMNQTLWAGCALAFVVHLLHGLSSFFPSWPDIGGFQSNPMRFDFTERPWNAMGGISANYYLGAIGVAYLLTREVSLSFWAFYFLYKFEFVLCDQLGFPPASLPADTSSGSPTFLTFQSVGGWVMMAVLLLWAARGHLTILFRAAWKNTNPQGEPFSPRLSVLGFAFSGAGMLAWCWFSGINALPALAFFAMYIGISVVLARLVVEGGFLFPQVPFAPLEVLTTAVMGSQSLGAAQITRLSFVQPVLFMDMRTNLLPGFLHTLKIAHDLKLEARQTRRLLGGAVLSVVFALGATCFVALATLYKTGGLGSYGWFAYAGGQTAFTGAAHLISAQTSVEPGNWLWMGVGAGVVLLLTLARSQFFWFPLHPLGYIVSSSFPIAKLWPSFFLGWAIKSLVLRYGGADATVRLRPFMIGLILGNATAMVFWMIIGFWLGHQISYWPA